MGQAESRISPSSPKRRRLDYHEEGAVPTDAAQLVPDADKAVAGFLSRTDLNVLAITSQAVRGRVLEVYDAMRLTVVQLANTREVFTEVRSLTVVPNQRERVVEVTSTSPRFAACFPNLYTLNLLDLSHSDGDVLVQLLTPRVVRKSGSARGDRLRMRSIFPPEAEDDHIWSNVTLVLEEAPQHAFSGWEFAEYIRRLRIHAPSSSDLPPSAVIRQFPRLQWLHIVGKPRGIVKWAHVNEVLSLVTLRRLRTLRLTHMEMTWELGEFVLPLPSLTRLELHQCSITHLSCMKVMFPNLHTFVTDHGLDAVASFYRHFTKRELRDIDRDANDKARQATIALHAAVFPPTVRTLSCTVTSDVNFNALSQVDSLTLVGPKPHGTHRQHELQVDTSNGQFAKPPRLSRLCVRGCAISPRALFLLPASLRYLKLVDCTTSQAALGELVATRDTLELDQLSGEDGGEDGDYVRE